MSGAPKAERAIGIVPFGERFQEVRRITPEQDPETLVASVRDVELRADGALLVADPSEGNVKVYDPDGRLSHVLGRKGEGPGEFVYPAYIEIDRRGRIHVADTQLNRLQVYDSAGVLTKTVNIAALHDIRGFAILSDDSFLFLAGRIRDTARPDVLIRTDTLAETVRTYLPIGDILPEGEAADPAWEFARNFFMDVRHDTAFVVSSVVNRLWTVSLDDAAVAERTVSFDGYDRPRLPPSHMQVKTAGEMMDWFLKRHLLGFVRVTDDGVFLPFIQGWMIRGDPMTLVFREQGGEWEVLADPPIIVDTRDNLVVTVDQPATDDMALVVYRRKAPQ